jgi:hypothetical protein
MSLTQYAKERSCLSISSIICCLLFSASLFVICFFYIKYVPDTSNYIDPNRIPIYALSQTNECTDKNVTYLDFGFYSSKINNCVNYKCFNDTYTYCNYDENAMNCFLVNVHNKNTGTSYYILLKQCFTNIKFNDITNSYVTNNDNPRYIVGIVILSIATLLVWIFCFFVMISICFGPNGKFANRNVKQNNTTELNEKN